MIFNKNKFNFVSIYKYYREKHTIQKWIFKDNIIWVDSFVERIYPIT